MILIILSNDYMQKHARFKNLLTTSCLLSVEAIIIWRAVQIYDIIIHNNGMIHYLCDVFWGFLWSWGRQINKRIQPLTIASFCFHLKQQWSND